MGPGCPYNSTSQRCDYHAAGAWFAEHGWEEHPTLRWTQCMAEDSYGAQYGNACPEGSWYGPKSLGCSATTTTTTPPPCTPERVTEPMPPRLLEGMQPFLKMAGACRGLSTNDYCSSYYEVRAGFRDLDACSDLCAKRPDCTGVSFKADSCELWTRAIGPVTEDVSGAVCLRKTGNELVPSGYDLSSGCGKFKVGSGPACSLTCPDNYELTCRTLPWVTSCAVDEYGRPLRSAWVPKQSGCGGSRCHETWANCCTCEMEDFLTFKPVNGSMDRACRGTSASDNSPSYYTLHSGVADLASCRALCVQEYYSCHGIEFNSVTGRCEVWNRQKVIETTREVEGYQCFGVSSTLVRGRFCLAWEPLAPAGVDDGSAMYRCSEISTEQAPDAATVSVSPGGGAEASSAGPGGRRLMLV